MAEMRRFIILVILLLESQTAYTQKEYHTLSSLGDFEQMESRLQQEPIIDISPFKKSGVQPTHNIQIITLQSGIKALFKTGEYHYAEVAGYRLSKLLKILLVPPTVFRSIKGTQGSLQLFISTSDLASLPYSSTLSKVSKKSIHDMNFFYYLAGQWDTHYGNQLIEKVGDKEFRLWLIDNAGMLHRSYSRYGGMVFIEKGTNDKLPSSHSEEFPFDAALTITGEQACQVFKPYIKTSKHLKALTQHSKLTYLIWNSTLWLAHSTEDASRIGRYTNTYYSSTLRACMNLTQENLTTVWAEWLSIDPSSTFELISLTLQRRDELLKASTFGTVINCL